MQPITLKNNRTIYLDEDIKSRSALRSNGPVRTWATYKHEHVLFVLELFRQSKVAGGGGSEPSDFPTRPPPPAHRHHTHPSTHALSLESRNSVH